MLEAPEVWRLGRCGLKRFQCLCEGFVCWLWYSNEIKEMMYEIQCWHRGQQACPFDWKDRLTGSKLSVHE